MGRVRDVVVRVLLRRRPPTPLPPKSQLPLSEYVYCYGPLDPDDPAGTTGWHWAPRKDYFDRSADAALEYYAPMSSSTSVNELPRSRRSSTSEYRLSGALRDTSGAGAGELDERLKQDEMLSSAADMLLSGTKALNDAAPGFCSPPAPLDTAHDGVFAFAVNIPCPAEDSPPARAASSLRNSARMTPLKSILKTPKTPTPALSSVSLPSPIAPSHPHAHFVPSPPPLQMPFLPPPLIPLPYSPPPPFIPPHYAHPGPASRICSSPPSPAVAHPIIPPFPFPAPAPFPSPPHVMRSPPALFDLHPPFEHAGPASLVCPSPPSPAVVNPITSPFLSPPHIARSPFDPRTQPAHPASLSPSPPLASPSSRPRGDPLHGAPRAHYPPGYASGVSSLLSAPGELRFSFRSPHALLRRRLDLAHRIPVAFSDPALAESAFYPAERTVLLVLPQLPWAVSLSARAEGWLTVGDVLSALREHLGARVRPAEREMLRAAGRGGEKVRGDALGDRTWLLGMWEDRDAVRRVVGAGKDEFVAGRRCFVVLFGSDEETMC